jgi:hypothetical protein
MKTTTTIRLILAVLTLAPLVGWAQTTPNPPGQISYQGFLTDASGIPLATNTPRNYTVTFRIYDASTGGNEKWAEQQVVTVDRGYFTVLLGNGSAIDSNFTNDLTSIFSGPSASDRYLGMSVAELGGNEIAPRLRLLASPYALLARNANSLISPNGASLVTSANGQLNINGTIAGDGSGLTSLNAGQLTAGTLPSARLIGTYSSAVNLNNAADSFSGSFNGNGSGLNSLNASQLTSGTLPDARLSGNVALRSAGNTFNGNQTFNQNQINYGYVGIGTASPQAPLHVVDSGWPSAIVQSSSTVGTWLTLKNSSAGGTSWNLISSGSGNGEGAGKLLLNGGYTIMTFLANGLIGIGTASPSKGALEIDSGAGYQPGYNPIGEFNNSGAHTGTIYAGGDISLWASGWIFADTFIAFSDERIKNIKGQSDSAADLKTLLGIKITDFTYRDTVANGNGMHKKVIAQQVQQVFPQAVTTSTNVVPDIYTNATVVDGWVQLSTDLKVGDRVKLIGQRRAGIYEVRAVRPGAFRTDFNPGSNPAPAAPGLKRDTLRARLKPENNHVFVYGREVKDFRSVDYDAISMLNVSATQELAKRVQKLEAREAHLAALEQKAARVGTLEHEVADLKKMVAQLLAANRPSKQTALAVPQTPALAAVASLKTPSATASLDH